MNVQHPLRNFGHLLMNYIWTSSGILGPIKDSVDPLNSAAKGEAEKLGHRVMAISNQIPALTGAAIGAASKTASSQMQTSLLEQTKTLVGE